MFPLNVILIGCEEDSAPHVRRELMNRSAHLEAEFSDVESAIDALRRSLGEKRLLILYVSAPRELDALSRLTISFPSWPVVALLNGDDYSNGSAGSIVAIMRAGASQVVSLPLQPDDFKAALDRIAIQFVYSARDTKVIAVAGATGGSGATTIAINLAFEIAHRHGLHCILVDLSLRLGVIASHLNIEPEHTIIDLLRDVSRVDTFLAQRVLTKVTEDLDILAGPHQLVAPVTTSAHDMTCLVNLLKQLASVVVLDVQCTYDDVYWEVLAGASQVVLIGEQKIPSIRALKMAHEALNRPSGTEHLVINRFDPKNKGFSVDHLLEPLGVSSLLTVARDDHAMDAALDSACPLRLAAPQSPALSDIVALAETLLDLASPPQAKPVGLFGRLGRALSNK